MTKTRISFPRKLFFIQLVPCSEEMQMVSWGVGSRASTSLLTLLEGEERERERHIYRERGRERERERGEGRTHQGEKDGMDRRLSFIIK